MSPQRLTFLAVAVLVTGAAAQAQVVTNGSLTGPIANGVAPPGWTIVNGSPDTMDQNNNVGNTGPSTFGATPSPSPDGGTWVGIGRQTGSFIETFGQTVTGLTVGTSYTVSWYDANFGYTGGYTDTNSVQALINGASIGTGAVRLLAPGWALESASFTATATSELLSFQLATAAFSYLSIDGISMKAIAGAVPEPETYALMLVGIAALSFVARRRG